MLRVAQAVMRTPRLFPSTGAMSILLAMSLCNRTDLYGFGLTNSTRCSKYYGPCTTPSLYFGHLSRQQILNTNKKLGHFVEVGGTYHDLESEAGWLESMGYTPPVKKDARIVGWDSVSLKIESWIDPKVVARERKQQLRARGDVRGGGGSPGSVLKPPLERKVLKGISGARKKQPGARSGS